MCRRFARRRITPEALASLDATTAALNEFAKSDKRAAEYVRTDQRWLAGDVVFGDGLERTDAALTSVEQVRLAELKAREALVGTFRARQVFALIAGAAASVLVVLLLCATREIERRLPRHLKRLGPSNQSPRPRAFPNLNRLSEAEVAPVPSDADSRACPGFARAGHG